MNHFEFLDEIEDALNAPDTADRDLLLDVSAHYSEAVAEVNRRLRKICQLIDQGFRSEALDIANENPDVLSQIATLDFPRLEEWCYLLSLLELQTPPKLNFELAEQLDVAFAEQEPLNDLLRRHRALAIGKAPLKSRITVLRQLIAKDPSNLGWQDDLKEWEKARLKEIRGDFNRYKASKNQEKILALSHEISGPWSVAIPGAIAAEIETLKRDNQTKQARESLQDTVNELNDALSAFDAVQGKILREKWEIQLPLAELDANDPLWDQVSEALAWLSECDQQEAADIQFNEAVHNLENALDREVSLEKLNRLVHAIDRFEKPWPAALERRLKRYENSVQQKQSRRFRLIVAVTLFLVASVAGGIFWVLQANRFQRNLSEATEELNTFYEAEDLQAARSFHDSLSESIKNQTPIKTLWSQIESKTVEREAQQKSFESALSSAEGMDFAQPNYDLIDYARKAIYDEDGKRRVDSLEDRVRKKQKEMLQVRHDVFLEKLADFEQRIATLVTLPDTEDTAKKVKALSKEMVAYRTECKGRIGRLPKIDNKFREKLAPLFKRLDRKENEVAATLKRDYLLARITNEVENTSVFYIRLNEFCQKNPEHHLTGDFKRAAEEWKTQKPLEAYTAWSDFFNKPTWARLKKAPSEAEGLLKKGKELYAKYPEIWLADKFNNYSPELETLKFGNTGESALPTLESVFKADFPNETGCIITDRPGRESPASADLNSSDINIYYIDYALNKLDDAKIKELPQERPRSYTYRLNRREEDKSKPFKKSRCRYIGATGQTKLLRELRSLTETSEDGSDRAPTIEIETQVLLKMIQGVVSSKLNNQPEEYCDPLVRIVLLKGILDYGVSTGVGGADDFPKWINQIQRLQNEIADESVDFIAVRNKNQADFDESEWKRYEDACGKALAIIQTVNSEYERFAGEIKSSRKRLASITQTAENQEFDLRPIGWISRTADDVWNVQATGQQSLQDQTVYCIYKDKGEKNIGLHPVGQLQKGVITIAPEFQGTAGRLVFAFK
ncbi:MAG: hypothetical protein P8J27_06295 [Mariniblastus sp.]|nr:hypothetical protein [Mariniblastus sp.]